MASVNGASLNKPQLRYWITPFLVIAALLLAKPGFAAVIQGTIYGGANACPNTVVTAYDAASQTAAGSSTTDGAGHYSITVSSGTYNLVVAPPVESGFPRSVVSGLAVADQDVIQNVVLVEKANVLSGVVRNRSNVPASNIRLNIKDQASDTLLASVITDAAGGYAVPLASGAYDIEVEYAFGKVSNVPAPNRFYVWPLVRNVQVAGATVRDLTLPFATLTGYVTDGNGAAVAGVQVKVDQYWSDTSSGGYTFKSITTGTASDASGAYSLVLIGGGDYNVTLTSPAGATFIQRLRVDSDMSRNLIMSTADVLTGVVRNRSGAPASNVSLTINNSATGTKIASVTTDANGEYLLPLASGNYEIDVQYAYGKVSSVPTPKTYYIWPLARNIQVAGPTTCDLTLPFVTLSGYTTDRNGVPVPGAKVKVDQYWSDTSSGGYTFKSITTDTISNAAGAYSIVLTAGGTYSVVVAPPAGSNFATTVQNLAVSNSDLSQDLVLSPENALSGVVRDPSGAAASNIRLDIKDQASETTVASLTTDAGGKYSVALADGTYEIDVQYAYGKVSGVATPKQFYIWPMVRNLAVSCPTSRDLVLPFVTLTGHTTDANGVPVPGVQVKVDQYWSDTSSGGYTFKSITTDAVSNASGAYALTLFAGGNYNVSIVPPGKSGFSQTVINNLKVALDTLQNVILSLPDTTAPVIQSGPAVSAVTDSSVVIEWQTNEPSTGVVNYGQSPALGGRAVSATARTIHSVPLVGLAADTVYYVSVSATDISNNGPTTSSVISFRTMPAPDTRPPVVLEGPVVSSITHTGAVVEWRTDEPSTGSVALGQSVLSDQVLATAHRVPLAGLTPSTFYSIKVSARDALNNGPTITPEVSFTTQAAPDTTAPVIVEGPLAVNLSSSEASIVWKTDEPATSGVSWNDGTAYGLVTDEGLLSDHNLRVTGLNPSTTYSVTVSSKDGLGNGPTLSSTFTFTTPAVPDTDPPVVIEGPLVVNVTHQSAVIRWDTDEPADSVVEYGTTAALGGTESRAALTKPHDITLTGLAAGTTYYFRVLSRDAAGNGPTMQGPYTFTTDPEPGNYKPVLTVGPQVIHQTDTTATIYWETDKPADTIVNYGKGSSEDLQRAEAAKTTKHQVTLVNLEAGQGYGVSIASTDLEGHTLVADAGRPIRFLAAAATSLSDAVAAPAPVTGFITNLEPDISPPVITEGPVAIAVTDKLAIIRWATDEISDSRVEYAVNGTALNLIAGDIRHSREHQVVLTNLMPNTAYSYRVGSSDPKGNGPARSQIFAFSTGSLQDRTGPFFNIPPAVTATTATGVTIAWSTNEPATTQLRYGAVRDQLTREVAVPGLSSNHSVTITDLKPGVTYYAEAVSSDASGNSSHSDPVQYTPPGATATVTVTLTGTGTGSVNSTPAGIACASGSSQGCSATFVVGETVSLTQSPSAHATFTGWSGDCSGSAPCDLLPAAEKRVTASFRADPAAVRIDGESSGYYFIDATLQTIVTSGKTMRARNSIFAENVIMATPVAVLVRGGFTDNAFSARTASSFTVIDGSLQIRNGTLRAERLAVR